MPLGREVGLNPSNIVLDEAEQGMGRWVMGHGSNGSRKSDGSHGSWVTRC